MRGHEYVRDAVCNYLADAVPALLTAHLASIGQAEPAPGGVTFLLADSLQDITTDFPVVAVRSTDATDDQRFSPETYGITYDLEVMVACDHRAYGDAGFDQASRARDRLLLAVREALWRVKGMMSSADDGDIEFLPGKRTERTGRGNVQTLDGVAMAVGTVSLRARVPRDRSYPATPSRAGEDAGQAQEGDAR